MGVREKKRVFRLLLVYALFGFFFMLSGMFQVSTEPSQLPLAGASSWLTVFSRFFLSYLLAQFLLFSLWPRSQETKVKVDFDEEEPPSLFDLLDQEDIKKEEPPTDGKAKKTSRRDRFRKAMRSD